MADIRWYGDTVRENILKMASGIIEDLGAEIIADAEPPQDTSFLESSAYLHSARINTFNATPPTGRYLSRRTKGEESRQRAPGPVDPPEGGAVIGWAAIYAGDVEERKAFVYPAVLRVAGRHK